MKTIFAIDRSNRPRAFRRTAALLLALTTVVTSACGEGEPEVSASRGPAGGTVAAGSPPAAGGADAAAPGAPPTEAKRTPRVLSREDFGPATRDPFQAFIGLDDAAPAEAPLVPILRQRDVKLAEYDFEDLVLIAIVRSPRGVRPRALFRATDGKSKTIQQGEYFSRAEVLLASVNRDYVEIEIVDEELAKSLGLARGETRAIYLKKE